MMRGRMKREGIARDGGEFITHSNYCRNMSTIWITTKDNKH